MSDHPTTISTGAERAPGAPRAGTRPASRHLPRATVLAAAPVAGLLAWLVLVPVLGLELDVRQGAEVMTVGPVPVVVVALLAGAAGWALLAALERWTRRARAWTPTAWVVLVLSLLGPTSAVDVAAGVGLVTLHLAVGAAVVAVLRPARA